MEGQSERTGGRRRRRRKKNKAQKPVNAAPVLIAARRPDSPLLATGTRRVVASASPRAANGSHAKLTMQVNGVEPGSAKALEQPKRRVARIVRASEGRAEENQREHLLIERLIRSQGRGAISRAADDLWECELVPPKEQRVQIQLLEHENERRAQEAVFVMAELLQKESPIQRPVLDQRLRRLEQFAEDPITRDAAGALRRSMRAQHGA